MPVLEINPIDNHNIDLVCDLLYQRNKTLKAYTKWKYSLFDDNRFRGLLALKKKKPIGCFGSIPKIIKYSNGEVKKCGWFADWYVIPSERGSKTGELLLNSLSDYEEIMFGHPGPKNAQKICLNNGYKGIGFHSRRRLVLNKIMYSYRRNVLFSNIKNLIKDRLKINATKPVSVLEKKINSFHSQNKINDPISIEFIEDQKYEHWITSQPLDPIYKRDFGSWNNGDYNIKYFDETLSNGERRRLLLQNKYKKSEYYKLKSFIEFSKKSKVDYMDSFTTDDIFDKQLQKLGAWRIDEPQILVRGVDEVLYNFNIQPWDRENWIYLN